MIEMIQINNYSHCVIFYIVTLEWFHSFNEQIIQMNNYLWAGITFLFGKIEVANNLSDFILLILVTSM